MPDGSAQAGDRPQSGDRPQPDDRLQSGDCLHPGDPLESARFVMRRARNVSIDDAAVDRWVRAWRGADLRAHRTPLDDVTGTRDDIANLILLIDSLNFCFWSSEVIACEWRGERVERYLAFAAAIAQAVRDDRRWLDAAFWADMTRAGFDAILPPRGTLLMCDERVAVLREVGATLAAEFGGRFGAAAEVAASEPAASRAGGRSPILKDGAPAPELRSAGGGGRGGGSAPRLARLLAERFASFRDAADYDGRAVWFLKRAQICAVDLHLAWQSRGFAGLDGLEQLTAFADYRVPQALRRLEIVRVAPRLAARIERREELTAGGADEVELRAASIEAVERMRRALSLSGRVAAAWEIDFELWARSHDADNCIEHHRTRTIFY